MTKSDRILREMNNKAIDRFGCLKAEHIMAPLTWYVRTSRINTVDLNNLAATNSRQQTTIIKRLEKSGGFDYDSAIDSVLEYLQRI